MKNLFSEEHSKQIIENSPLAYKARPKKIEDFIGQKHILDKGEMLRNIIDSKHLVSVLFFGPPGCGKSTLAQIIANDSNANFKKINAVSSNVADIRNIIEYAKNELSLSKKRTILFIDEIHRFNKSQQDCLLPAVESGEIILIGATTFNPFFYVIPALLSRMLAFEFKNLNENEIKIACENAILKIYNKKITFNNDSFLNFIEICSYDIRRILNLCEIAIETKIVNGDILEFNKNIIDQLIKRTSAQYDRDNTHYEVISAFIKSIRASEPDAALHYLARMIEGGEDIRFIARRLVISASEDIANANPMAIVVAQSIYDAVEKIGMPEASILLANLTTYLSSSPKSNCSHIAFQKALKDVQNGYIYEIPDHLKNIKFNSSAKYINPHSFKFHVIHNNSENYQQYCDREYYFPSNVGAEKKINEYLYWKKTGKLYENRSKNKEDK